MTCVSFFIGDMNVLRFLMNHIWKWSHLCYIQAAHFTFCTAKDINDILFLTKKWSAQVCRKQRYGDFNFGFQKTEDFSTTLVHNVSWIAIHLHECHVRTHLRMGRVGTTNSLNHLFVPMVVHDLFVSVKYLSEKMTSFRQTPWYHNTKECRLFIESTSRTIFFLGRFSLATFLKISPFL